MSSINPVAPAGTVSLYSGVNWGSDYKDIRWFRQQSERTSYLTPLRVGFWEKVSVIRENTVKLEGSVNNFLNVNYMSFTNRGISTNDKSFYAFVKSVDYININTFSVTYEIDWVQSFLFDIQFEESFVEFEHVLDDTRGKWTKVRNLDIGEYVIDSQLKKVYQPAFVALYADEAGSAEKVNNVFTALQWISGKETTLLENIASQYAETPEKIASIFMCYDGEQSMHDTYALTKETTAFKFGSETYNPKNNIMQCYPYKLFTVDNFDGKSQQFRWEDFQSVSQATFAVEGCKVPKPCLECIPLNYRGSKATSAEVNTVQQFSVTYDNFPQVPWVSDTFRAWISQYQSYGWISDAASVATTIAGMALTGGSGAIMGLYSLGTTGISKYNEYKEHQLHNTQMHGSIGSAGLSFARGDIGFRFTQYSIRPEYAREIDKIYTRYGYPIDTQKVPNITGRQYYNYVKCGEAHVAGTIPVDTKRIMENALMSGVTFWHTNNVGTDFESNPIV